jgi:DNA-binding transcriptional ArsR family regulator
MVKLENRTLRRTRNEVQRHEAAALFRNLGNSNRIAILGALLDRERAVGELETELGIRQPILSQQLAILREAGLLETTRDRKSIVYRLADRHAPVVARALRAVLGPTADAKHPAEAPPTAKPRAEPFLAAAVFARVDQAQNG